MKGLTMKEPIEWCVEHLLQLIIRLIKMLTPIFYSLIQEAHALNQEARFL